MLPHPSKLDFPSLLEIVQPLDQPLGLVPCGPDLLGKGVERALSEPARRSRVLLCFRPQGWRLVGF